MSLVRYEVSDHIATITLNRPDAMNALNRELLRELRDTFKRFRIDDDAWVAIVTGAGGRAFSAGADLKEMSARPSRGDVDGAPRPSGFARLMGQNAGDLFGGTELWKPLIAAIEGYCLAGGLELALSCDMRVAAEDSLFGLTEVTRGIIPGGGGTQRLTKALPLAIAMELLLTGRRMSVEDAFRYGLLNRLTPRGEAMTAALELARAITANAPLSVRAAKEAALRGLDLGINEGLRVEAFLARLIGTTEDAREGPLAFAEKRAPRYKGR